MEAKEAIGLLPAKIKVIVTEDNLGYLTIAPVDPGIKKLVGATNQYDFSSDAYIASDEDIRSFLADYPKARMAITRSYAESFGGHKIGRRWYQVNDCATFYMSSYDFRHLVGGQSD